MKLAIPIVFAVALQSAAPSDQLSQSHAVAFEKKLAAIVLQSMASPKAAPQPRQTMLPQNELNSYLKFKGPEVLPAGVTDASLQVAGGGRLSARATVDLDIVRKKGSGSLLDPKSYLTGRLPLTMHGTLTTAKGVARFDIEEADVSGVPVPPSLVHELVSYYSKSEDYPGGVDLVKGFQLPAGIERIDVQPGRMIVVQ